MMEEVIHFVRQVLGDKVAGVPDAMLAAKLAQLPIRLALVGILACVLLRARPDTAVNTKRLFVFQIMLPILGIFYTIDLFGYLNSLYDFEHPYSLPLFSRLLFGETVSATGLLCLEVVTLVAFLITILKPNSTGWKLVAFLGFALAESLVYGYGYTENTFTSFRLAQAFLVLYSVWPNRSTIYYGQAAILLCYGLPGMEKLLSFAFGLLNAEELKNYADWFHLNPELFRLAYGAGLVLQVSMLAGLRYGNFRKLAPLMLISFHLGTALMGVGGLASPWIPALLFLLV